MTDQRKAAAAILLERRNARDHLLPFTEYTRYGWETGEHHKVICAALEKVERGEIDRLLIQAPPRHSKSELASRRFPAWFLGRHPAKQLITASYGDDLAHDIGADVRDILRDIPFKRLFPNTELRPDTTAAGRWRTTQNGIYIASGVGGPIVGRGAHVAIIDDPHKNRDEADSARMRDVVFNWYMGALRTRLMPGGAIVIMMTRWHEDDLPGRLIPGLGEALDESGGGTFTIGQWTVVDLQAVNPKGEALWPGGKAESNDPPHRYPLSELNRIRKDMVESGRAREWRAQYQQRPTSDEGTFIKAEWFKERYEKLPEAYNVYIASDFAVTEPPEGHDPDYTEHGVFGVGPDDKLYVLDWWSGRVTPDKWIDELLRLVRKHKPLTWFGESGVIRRSVEPFLTKMSREQRIYFHAEWVSPIKDKATRAQSFKGRAASGKVIFPKLFWAEEVIDQCVRFPSARYDDKFDTMALMCLAIDEAHPGILRSPPLKKRRKDWQGRRRAPLLNWKVV